MQQIPVLVRGGLGPDDREWTVAELLLRTRHRLGFPSSHPMLINTLFVHRHYPWIPRDARLSEVTFTLPPRLPDNIKIGTDV